MREQFVFCAGGLDASKPRFGAGNKVKSRGFFYKIKRECIASLSHGGNNSAVCNEMLKGCVRDPKMPKCAGVICFLCGVCLTRQNPDLGREPKGKYGGFFTKLKES